MLTFSHLLLRFSTLWSLIIYNIVMLIPVEYITMTHTQLKSAFLRTPFTYIAWNVFILPTRLHIDYLLTVKMWEKFFYSKGETKMNKKGNNQIHNEQHMDWFFAIFPPHCIPNCIKVPTYFKFNYHHHSKTALQIVIILLFFYIYIHNVLPMHVECRNCHLVFVIAKACKCSWILFFIQFIVSSNHPI